MRDDGDDAQRGAHRQRGVGPAHGQLHAGEGLEAHAGDEVDAEPDQHTHEAQVHEGDDPAHRALPGAARQAQHQVHGHQRTLAQRGHHAQQHHPDQQAAHGLFRPGGGLREHEAAGDLPHAQAGDDRQQQAGHGQAQPRERAVQPQKKGFHEVTFERQGAKPRTPRIRLCRSVGVAPLGGDGPREWAGAGVLT